MIVHSLPQHEEPAVAVPTSAMSRWASPKHKAAERSFGYALTLGDAMAWHGFAVVLLSRLSLKERVSLAYAVLLTIDQSDYPLIVEAVTGNADCGIGAPIPAFDSVMAEASFWADMAQPFELDAYALASFNRMAPSRQSAFLVFIKERAVA